jgi:5-methylcytosine-specific restriction protein A
MPQLASHPCATQGCSGLTKHARFCAICVAQGKASDRRPSAAARGYGPGWKIYRINYLRAHPFCADPFKIHGLRMDAQGRHNEFIPVATRVDHIKPHRGDQELFWDPTNHQPLCERCHNRKTVEFDGGFGRIRTPMAEPFLI